MPPKFKHPPGTIAVGASDTGRFTAFTAAISGLDKPDGTTFRYETGGDIVANRNRVASDFKGEWLWFMDDDHSFAGDVLMRLLDMNVPVAVPVVLMRAFPFHPAEFVSENTPGFFDTLDLAAMPTEGTTELYAAGTAGMLIRREVFSKLEQPFFERAQASEDLMFSARLREAGIPIVCNLGVRLSHLTVAAIWPTNDHQGNWYVGLDVGGFPLQIVMERKDAT